MIHFFLRVMCCISLMAQLTVAQLTVAQIAVAQISITGDEVAALKSFDEMMAAFLAEHQVAGASLAIAKDGAIIYSRGFGLANVETKQPVQPASLFRIASLSKPITAAAVMKLVEAGKLKLDDRIVDLLGLDIPPQPQGDPRWKKITIEHLLHHTAGFDRDKSFDPMFRSRAFATEQRVMPPAGAKDVIACMVARLLDFEPGTKMAYSNFGYCLLGRAIEKASGQSYEAYVKEHVLEPVGVKTMRIGATRSTAKDEVTYYGFGARTGENVFASRAGEPAKVLLPYGAWHLEAMDSHGGWIASAPDLLRFASIMDGDVVKPGAAERPSRPVLSSDSIKAIFAGPMLAGDAGKAAAKSPVFYGFGWQVREVGNGQINTWHNGALSGTSSLLVRRHDGLSWAVLFNGDTGKNNQKLSGLIDGLMHQTAAKVKAWQ